MVWDIYEKIHAIASNAFDKQFIILQDLVKTSFLHAAIGKQYDVVIGTCSFRGSSDSLHKQATRRGGTCHVIRHFIYIYSSDKPLAAHTLVQLF